MKKLGSIIDKLKEGGPAPTRHHNPYLIEAISLEEYLYTTEELAQKNKPLFQNENNKLVIEIGCYMGKNILEFAQQNKNINFIGLDITYKRSVKSSRKLKREKITNAKIAICEGKYFLQEFTLPHSVSGICVFFPDPWPKEKQEKNRLLKQDFIDLLNEKLESGGFFWFKTDAKAYFLETEKILLQSGFIADDAAPGVPLNKPTLLQGGPYETAFQKIFIAKQVPFYQRVYLKR